MKVQKEYNAFNLVVYSVHTNRAYYINNKNNMQEPRILNHNENYGLCNIDIDTIWEKTRYGLDLYQKVVNQAELPSAKELVSELDTIMKDKKSFNKDPNAEASIFVPPYYCTLEKAERKTKSTTYILIRQDLTVEVRETTYLTDKEASVTYSNSF